VPSSISSSSRRLPQGDWLSALAAALVILALVICGMEFRLAARGFQPTTVDSQRLWVEQRARASALGENALILLGNSRMQLDLDTATVRSQTPLVPVQLAIDGSSYMPILAGLARDPSIRGTVLIQYSGAPTAAGKTRDLADEMQAAYEDNPRFPLRFATSEAYLTDALHSRLRSYADGTRPVTALLKRILALYPTPQYLITLPDRSRAADYSKLTMPDTYFRRVIRNLGQDVQIEPGVNYRDLDQQLRLRIAALAPMSDVGFDQNVARMNAMVNAIQRRGGRVIFAVFPTSGLVKATDDARYPRERFWNRFAASTSATTLNFEDVPALRDFTCPDGSHLDMRDKAPFTNALIKATGLDRPLKR